MSPTHTCAMSGPMSAFEGDADIARTLGNLRHTYTLCELSCSFNEVEDNVNYATVKCLKLGAKRLELLASASRCNLNCPGDAGRSCATNNKTNDFLRARSLSLRGA
jgi:hypothetical protein